MKDGAQRTGERTHENSPMCGRPLAARYFSGARSCQAARGSIMKHEPSFNLESASVVFCLPVVPKCHDAAKRSEEHTSELQSLMRISYAVFCLKKKNTER